MDWQNFSIKKNQKQNQQKPVEQNHGILFFNSKKKILLQITYHLLLFHLIEFFIF